MRHIKKHISPEELGEWTRRYKSTKGRLANYKDLENELELKKNIKEELISEQLGLCCYCCKSINYNNSHIEHFRPRDTFPKMSVDYTNLHACCMSSGKSKRCGTKKENLFHADLVSHLEEKCELLFEYNFNGNILPANGDQRASFTIEQLGLDQYVLQEARAAAIRTTGLATPFFNEEEKKFWIDYFEKTKDGKLEQFCAAVLYCLKN